MDKKTKKEREKSVSKKNSLLEIYAAKAGNISEMCKAVDIPRSTYYKWMKDDESFKDAVHTLDDAMIDYVESKLVGQIAKGNMTAIIFFLKCKGRTRGWIERESKEISGPDGGAIPVQFLVKFVGE
jgi:hypothetical protein